MGFRKKNPQYEHCAVIIAEDITSRFLNVISLFNGFIPLIAIQVKAVKIDGTISLFFTKVLDEIKFELLDEDVVTETVDREYWEKKATKDTLNLTDKIINTLGDITREYNLKYNKHYIGLENNNIANNFLSFFPKKSIVIMNFRLEKIEELDEILGNSDIDILSYDKQLKQYRFRLTDADLESESSLNIIRDFSQKAKEEYMN